MADVFGVPSRRVTSETGRALRLSAIEEGSYSPDSPHYDNSTHPPLICLIDADVREEAKRKRALFYRAAACFRKSH